MDRRRALRTLALGGIGAASVPAWVTVIADVAAQQAHEHVATLQSASATWTPALLSPEQERAVTVLAELIIPRTDTAGATDALVNRFIDTVLEDAPEAERNQFLGGLRWLDERSREVFGADFADARPQQQTALLTILAAPENESLGDRTGVEFFQAMKQLTVTGYYTSQVGMAEELNDDGRMTFADDDGCVHPEHQS
jgi:hypothetical protein